MRIESLGAVWAVLLVGVSSPAAVLSLISSQNFGSLALNTGAPGSATLTFQISSSPSSFQLQYGGDFSLGRHACTGAAPYTCTVTLSFAPQYPGLRQDAVRVLDSGGNVLATTLLYGLGLAPQAVLRPGVLTSFAGTGTLGNSGDNGAAVRAELSNPQGVAVDGAGNVYIADSLAQVIRKVNVATGMITTVVGPANSAGLNAPTGIAVDGAGNLYIADSQNNQIRKLDAVSGLITTVAGTGAVSASLGDGNLATQASLHNPSDVAVDPPGNLYIADEYNNRIRRVDAGTGVITTVAGGGTPGRGADGIGDAGPAVNAVLSDPSSVAFDSAGNLYIADSGNNLIREVNNGTISVVAGNGSPAYSGDNGAATQASLNQPSSVRVDAAGNLYIVDSHNNVIRQVNGAGIISSAVAAGQLNNPGGIAIDPSGNIYIADQGNSLVREITSGSAVLNFGATGVGTVSSPQIVSIDNIGNQALAIGGLSLTESFLQQSSGAMDCSLDVTVAPAAYCSVAVAFVPQSASSFTGDLSLLTNSLNGTSLSLQVVVLSGSGTGTGNESSDPAVNTVDLVFPYQTVGAASASQVVTLQNPGSTTVNVTGIWIAGSNAGDFSLNSTCQSTLAAHGTCTVSVVFTPQAAGARSATLSLTETGAVSGAQFTQSVFLQGIAAGMPGAITITPSVAFGTQAVGTVSSAQTVTLTNSSSVGLTIAGASLSGSSDFSISSNSCTSLLHPNNSCNVVLAFSPTVIGQEQASLEFTDQAGNSPQTVTVQGTGAIPILQSAEGSSSANLGETGLGGSTTLQLAFTNKSQALYLINAVTINGANAADFTASNGCGSGVASGSSCIVTLLFKPLAVGVRTAALTIVGSGVEVPVTVALAGTAIGQNTFGGAKSGDIRASGDFDGDGISDYVVWRPSTGVWYVIPSSHPSSLIIQQWGWPGDIPVPGDYDGDGKTDFAVWRPSTGVWYVIPSSHPSSLIIQQWGWPGDIPVPGDYNGDGKTDFAVWRPSTGTWFALTGNTVAIQQWGWPGDIPVPGDYNGDGKTDFAIWRPSTGTWFALTGNTVVMQQWGWPGDIPVPGDYDGDGKTDFTVWRPSSGTWYVLSATKSNAYSQQWGWPADIPR